MKYICVKEGNGCEIGEKCYFLREEDLSVALSGGRVIWARSEDGEEWWLSKNTFYEHFKEEFYLIIELCS